MAIITSPSNQHTSNLSLLPKISPSLSLFPSISHSTSHLCVCVISLFVWTIQTEFTMVLEPSDGKVASEVFMLSAKRVGDDFYISQ
jgi:hypothetical protein